MPSLDATKFNGVMLRIANELKEDPHHRLLSWDHAREHWQKFVANIAPDQELAALHLAFYLASWGMYRGRSDLLFRDYKVLIPAVNFLKAAAYNGWSDFIFETQPDPSTLAGKLRTLANSLSRELIPKLARPGKPKWQVNVSDTLLSKILLSTLVCVPAFDAEVKASLRDILGSGYPTGDGFDDKRLAATIALARQNLKVVTGGQVLLREQLGTVYPLTKVFDFYLWHHGLDLPKKEKDKGQ